MKSAAAPAIANFLITTSLSGSLARMCEHQSAINLQFGNDALSYQDLISFMHASGVDLTLAKGFGGNGVRMLEPDHWNADWRSNHAKQPWQPQRNFGDVGNQA